VSRPFSEEKTDFSTSGAGKIRYQHNRVKIDFYLIPSAKMNSNGVKDLNVRSKRLETLGLGV
jgi:hypothetical protein